MVLGESKENMVLVSHDAYSGIMEYEATVVKDAKTLNKFYSQINRTRKPGLPVPEIDFEKNILLVICLGKQEEGATYSLKKEELEGNILITTNLSVKKEASENENSIISYPFYIYKIPNTSKIVSFQKEGW
ncbi:hypothetical protein [Flagellimonas pacifica]|uniref:PrcB C-terminal domain-containing protein n=1 Tax=Flagellimonas pacifica TaxID=1247520 RepID=A0A285MR04_9FLAO|nr:hypothetical protein [Allomuricauda parva]SNY99612.1 hypothetical protein SAMN06265377_1423 [Allomuricauda parva]